MDILTPRLPKDLTTITDLISYFDEDDDITESHIENQVATGADLSGINISHCLINKSDFSLVAMDKFDISNTEIKNTNLMNGTFRGSSWRTVKIDASRCSGLGLQDSSIKNLKFSNSKLDIANFRFAKIENMIFEDCVLDDTDFYGAQLKNVDFINCTISKISFASAKMKNVNLSKSTIESLDGVASIKGATINYDQLMQLAPYFAAEAGINVR